jgi:lysophospholipase L1-like esterase
LGTESGLILIDTQSTLNGQHEKFIDLVHLTQEGRQSLAEAIYQGLEVPLRNLNGEPVASE